MQIGKRISSMHYLGRLLLLFHRAKDECKRAQNDEANPSFVGTTGVFVGSELFLFSEADSFKM
jgi:hypothetical protein